jgi:NTE family protein
MTDGGRKLRVAVACQGGGSHTAFTAGVLKELLRTPEIDIRALSGTSGGAVCAVLAWSGLLDGSPGEGITRLDDFWEDNATCGPWDDPVPNAMRAFGALGITPEISPYFTPFDARGDFLRLLTRHVPFAKFTSLPTDAPRLLVSAADVHTGEFRVFRSHRIGKAPASRISSKVVLASSAVPTLFRTVHLCDEEYWDGLFSQNPPLRELPDAVRGQSDGGEPGPPPDEIWVVLVNPIFRRGEPRLISDIRDRRNELAANISFQQEVYFIAHMNRLVKKKALTGKARKKYSRIKIRAITMADDMSDQLDYESKLQRDRTFIRRLMCHGEQRARMFLELKDAPDGDERTAIPLRDIWGRWTAPESPCLSDADDD